MHIGELNHMPAVKLLMTPFPYSVMLDEPLAAATALMDEHAFSHLPVTTVAGELVGVLSRRDVELVVATLGGPQTRVPLVRDASRGDVYVVDLNEPVDAVLTEMARRHIGSAVVVKHGRLAGVFTHTDACQRFAEFLRARFPDPGRGSAA